jgi:7-cyano-7-deazaguanine synthase
LPHQAKRAVLLCSGGVDSTTVMAMAHQQGYELYSLSFRYGQRHEIEIAAAESVSRFFGVARHLVLNIDLDKIGGSALTDAIDVPKGRKHGHMAGEIPATYVPARNTIFLSYALAWAEVLGAADIFIGVNALDYSGYPDCRPEYIAAFEAMANLATKAGVEGRTKITIHAPLQHMSKVEIIKTGAALGVDYSMTHSCYDPLPDGTPCTQCDSCILRKKGFDGAGIKDGA